MKISAAMFMGLFCVSAWAQKGVSVKMTLTDSRTGEEVGFATVSLTAENEDKPYKYVVSNSKGEAEFSDVRAGKYVLRAELMGYKNYEDKIEVAGNDINLGKLKMHTDAQRLNAATITDAGNPIIVKKDTIEYNASSFKTTDNDMLEDLLKKLPGVEVGTDGSVTANGETISKITIDGKTFFLDDPQLATKNIPAKIVEKVKVVEKKSDQAIFTGIDDGEEETVIDLSIQKGMMNGWFGNVMGGGGHDLPDKGYYKSGDENWKNDGWRYQGAAMVGRFTDSSQLSLILNGNNTNNRGFNDMAGSMMQNMRGGRGMGRGTGGWGANNGITTSWMTGLNGVFNLLDGRMDLGGNYVYNGSDKYVEEDSHKITYMDDGSSLDYTSTGTSIEDSQGHRFGIRLEHYFTESTSILFEPQVRFGSGYFHEYSDYTTYTDPGTGESPVWTNDGFTDNRGWNSSWATSGFLLFRQRLGKPGRTISVNVRYDFSGNKLDGRNQSLTSVLSDEVEGETVDEIVNQRYHSVSNSSSIEVRAVYTEPIATNFFLEFNYSYSWNQNKSTKDTYDSHKINGQDEVYTDDDGTRRLRYDSNGETYNTAYSSNITNKYQNHNAGADFIYQKDKFRAQLGAAFRPTITDNETNGEIYHSSVMNWSPQAMVSYDFGENSNVRFFYFGRSEQPSTSQLMPVADNSDPLNISFGNPYLEPYFTHRLRGRFAYTNKQTFTSVHAGLGGSLVQNTITNAMWYDSNGAQYAMPLNGKNSGSVDLRVMVNSPFARSKFSIFNMTVFSYSNSMSYVGKTESNRGDELINDYYNPEDGTLNYKDFNDDFFGDNPTKNFHDYFTDSKTETFSFTERLRFTFRSDLVEINVGGRTRMSKSWYSITEYNQKANWDNEVEASMNWTIPGGVGLVAEGRYNWYNGYTTKQDDEIIFNAEISKLLFKNRFTLALKAYDIFNQSKNLHVSDESNYHQETRNNTLGRYIMLSLTFRFGTFNGNNNRRGPGGPGGPPPGGPMGGPPRR